MLYYTIPYYTILCYTILCYTTLDYGYIISLALQGSRPASKSGDRPSEHSGSGDGKGDSPPSASPGPEAAEPLETLGVSGFRDLGVKGEFS